MRQYWLVRVNTRVRMLAKARHHYEWWGKSMVVWFQSEIVQIDDTKEMVKPSFDEGVLSFPSVEPVKIFGHHALLFHYPPLPILTCHFHELIFIFSLSSITATLSRSRSFSSLPILSSQILRRRNLFLVSSMELL